jgi:hypothetical protein
MMNNVNDDDCGCTGNATGTGTNPPVDPTMKGISDRFFTSVRADAYKCIRPQERDVLVVPWGPRIDVVFDPKGAAGIVGGRVRVMARTSGAEVEIANLPLLASDQPVSTSVAMGCDEYVIKAQLGSDPGMNARRTDSYVFARVYHGR